MSDERPPPSPKPPRKYRSLTVEQRIEPDASREAETIASLRRWLREHEDNAKRLHAEIEALRRLLHRGIQWPSMSMDQSLWIREVKEWLEPHDG